MSQGEEYKNYFGLTRDPLFWEIREKYLEDPLFLPNDLGCFIRVEFQSPWGKTKQLMSWASYESTPLFYPEKIRKNDFEVLAKTLKDKTDWDLLHWSRLTPLQCQHLKDAFEARGMPVMFFPQTIYGLQLEQGITHAWNQLSKKYRDAYKNACSRLRRNHGDTVSSLNFSDIHHVYSKRHERMGNEDYSVQPKFLKYLEELRSTFLKAGRWCECGVRVQNQVIAFACGFFIPLPEKNRNQLFVYQIGFDPEYAKLSPGRQATWTLVENEDRKSSLFGVDFMSEGDHFKVICPQPFQYSFAKVFGPTPKGRLLYIQNQLSSVKKSFSGEVPLST